LWHCVQAALIFACIGPGGSGLPGASGAWANVKEVEAASAVHRKISLNMQVKS
jgi:hypothetical protein